MPKRFQCRAECQKCKRGGSRLSVPPAIITPKTPAPARTLADQGRNFQAPIHAMNFPGETLGHGGEQAPLQGALEASANGNRHGLETGPGVAPPPPRHRRSDALQTGDAKPRYSARGGSRRSLSDAASSRREAPNHPLHRRCFGHLLAPDAGADERAFGIVADEAALHEHGGHGAQPQDRKPSILQAAILHRDLSEKGMVDAASEGAALKVRGVSRLRPHVPLPRRSRVGGRGRLRHAIRRSRSRGRQDSSWRR